MTTASKELMVYKCTKCGQSCDRRLRKKHNRIKEGRSTCCKAKVVLLLW